MSHLVPALSSLAVLIGVGLQFYARMRFVPNPPDDSPFAGPRWRPLLTPRQYRPPGFAVFALGLAIAAIGVVIDLVQIFVTR